jgi:transcriptional regulator with XRE-family HTH domain
MIKNRIKEILKESALRQIEFAKSIGISQGSLNELINKDRLPSAETIIALKNEYNINPTWLLTGEGEMYLPEKKQSSSDIVIGNNIIIKDTNIEINKNTTDVNNKDLKKIVSALEKDPELLRMVLAMVKAKKIK